MPTDEPDHKRRVPVGIEHRLAPTPAVIGPRVRFNEPIAVDLGGRRRRRGCGYSADGAQCATNLLALVRFALCRWRWPRSRHATSHAGSSAVSVMLAKRRPQVSVGITHLLAPIPPFYGQAFGSIKPHQLTLAGTVGRGMAVALTMGGVRL
jgi:hypothetical protein